MKERISALETEGFVSALSSSAPVPGGGGAAALCGALSAALCAMASNISAAKKPEMQGFARSAESSAASLLALIDKDAECFEPLSKAYSLPKDTPGYAEIKEKAIITAASAPLDMLRRLTELTELICSAKESCSKLLLSDLGCAAALCAAAMKAAAMNVFVNTRLLKGNETAGAMAKEAQALLDRYIPLADRLEKSVMDYLTA